jgi:chromosomal replication initiator protein
LPRALRKHGEAFGLSGTFGSYDTDGGFMDTALKTIWQTALEALCRRIGEARFNLWFKNTNLLELAEGVASIGVASLFVRDWLEDHYRTVLEEVLSGEAGERVKVAFRIDAKLFQASRRREAEVRSEVLDDLSRPAAAAARVPEVMLRAEFRLDNFVVGSCNRLAYAAARQLAESSNASFNPLFVHGDVGLGKTHLLQGVCNYVNAHFPHRRAHYTSAEGFTNQFVTSIRHRSLDAFRYKFRNVDLLAIDDVHFLASKTATQDEFLHTFDALDLSQKQVLMASDAHPKQIRALKEALVSRCVAGMVVELERPELETRLAILKQKAAERRCDVPEDVLLYLAEQMSGSVRELEGAVNVVSASAVLAHRSPDLDFVRQVLARTVGAQSRQVTPQEVVEAAAAHYGVPVPAMAGSSRSRQVSAARQVAMFLVRELTHMSYQEIAHLFGRREHSTVLFACRKVTRTLSADPSLRRAVEELRERLRGSRSR